MRESKRSGLEFCISLGRTVAILLVCVAPLATAQGQQSASDATERAADSAFVIEDALRDIPADEPLRRTWEGQRRKIMLEDASSLLLEISDQISQGASPSETRPSFVQAARLLQQAYESAMENGGLTEIDQMRSLDGLLRDLDAYHDLGAREDAP
jgi:hypothetical protein